MKVRTEEEKYMDLNSGKPKRIEWIDVAKGFGIVFVLFNHVITSFARRIGDHAIVSSLPMAIVSSFFMPLFFYLSGIFIQSNLKKDFKVVFKNKFVRLMIPYFVWGVISVLFWALYSHNDPIIRIIELPIRPIFVLWFVYSMFLSIILFWILNKHLPISIVVIISILMYIIGDLFSGNIGIDSFLKPGLGLFQNFLFLELGYLTRKFIIQETKHAYIKVLLSLAILIGLNMVYLKNIPLRIALNLTCAILGIIFICELSKVISSWNFKNDIMSILGFYSMEIYLIHKIVVEAVSFVLIKLTSNAVLYIALNIIITVLICFIIIKVIQKLKLSKIFFGANQ